MNIKIDLKDKNYCNGCPMLIEGEITYRCGLKYFNKFGNIPREVLLERPDICKKTNGD